MTELKLGASGPTGSSPASPDGGLLSALPGRKQMATRIFFVLALAIMATTSSAWPPVAMAVMLVLGFTLVRFATIGRAWTALYLIGQKKHQLVTSGPYSMCRNPLYFFTLVGLTGIALSFGSLLAAALIVGWFGVYYPRVIRKEEAKLAELHGHAYVRFRETTPALFPRPALLKEAAAYTVQPAHLRANTKDYVWMIWGLGLVQVFAVLHQGVSSPSSCGFTSHGKHSVEHSSGRGG